MMRLILLTALTMVAFAANSLLNRVALADGLIGPASFAAIRVASGAIVLCLLALAKGGLRRGVTSRHARVTGTLSLALYMLGFSFAYLTLDAGIGALLLFGVVQLTMFGGAVASGETIPLQRWIGAAVALTGLAILCLAGAEAPPFAGVLLMTLAAVGWGIYSLNGRGSVAPLADTGLNFLFALPLAVALLLALPDIQSPTTSGVLLAMLSGAVTSGLGYALWYAILPALGASRAAVAQLTVPVIAVAGGAMFLGEAVTVRAGLSAVLILGGVAVSLIPSGRAAREDRS